MEPSNPLLETPPKFSEVAPRHLEPAAQKTIETLGKQQTELEERLQTNPVSPTELLEEVSSIQSQLRFMKNIFRTLELSNATESSWVSAAKGAQRKLRFDKIGTSGPIYQAAVAAYGNASLEERRRLELLLRECMQHGTHLTAEQKDTYQQIQDTLVSVNSKLESFASQNSTSKRDQLESVHQIKALQTYKAKALGFGDMVSAQLPHTCRMSSTELRELYQQIGHAGSSILEEVKPDDWDLAAPSDQEVMPYLSLNGLMLALEELTRVFLGVLVHEDTSASKWHTDVRVLTVTDEASGDYIGSIYMDPFFRPTKSELVESGPLLPDSQFIMCQTIPPIWEDQATDMKYTDALEVASRYGRALQGLLAQHRDGLCGTEHTPAMFQDLLSQFYSGVLQDRTFLQLVAQLSGSPVQIPKHMMDRLMYMTHAMSIDRILKKCLKAEVELDLFQPLQEDESLVAMQRRLIQTYTEHDPTHRDDLTVLLEVAQKNAGLNPICHHTPLLTEVVAADITAELGDVGNQERLNEMGRKLRTHILEP
ncbi:MAG: M3 family metallopeptidase, partial [Myxococcota bacterium]